MASRRQYLTTDELAEYADITISDQGEAEDQISQAEELIDAFVGPVCRFVGVVYQGIATASGVTSLTDTSNDSPLDDYDQDFYKGCELEIMSGDKAGTRVTITGSTKAGVVTFGSISGLSGAVAYRVRQLGKFPRLSDVMHDTTTAGSERYYKTIPEAVRRATAAQVEYMIQKGADFFAGDGSDLESETIDDYSYKRRAGGSLSSLIAPKARAYLRGLVRRGGQIIVD